MDYNKLAELLFPDIKEGIEDIMSKYPPRTLKEGAQVTRLGPSPTGYLHIGHLYSAMISKITAQNSGGVFYLRIEDTDQKRYIKGAGDVAYDMLCYYGVVPDEGYQGDDKVQIGNYGDYVQSHRTHIYKVFAKHLVKIGRAFPCFCTASESKQDILDRREKDLEALDTITEHDEVCRSLTLEQIEANIKAGKPWALKLLSQGDINKQHDFVDLIKGKRVIRENAKDVVLIKSNGIPPYALAHVVDDSLMHTTIVVRGEEWYPSVSAHLEIFSALGLKAPKYAHTPVISKIENGNKRKLSKRKDPEADVRFYIEQGYPIESVKEYVMGLLNSDFEMWRETHKTDDISLFPFSIKKIGSNNPMFDFDKLDNVSKNVIGLFSPKRIAKDLLTWAKNYDKDFYSAICDKEEFLVELFSIDRVGVKNPRKDIAKYSDVKNLYSYMFFPLDMPKDMYEFAILNEDIAKILNDYKTSYDLNDDKETWFNKIKAICTKYNYCANMKEYKLNPQLYKGSIADVSSIIRVALTGKANTPDLYYIMKLLGKEEIDRRIDKIVSLLQR